MSDEVHESYVRQLLDCRQVPQVTAWQRGEPTLLGLDLLRHPLELQKKYAKLGTRIENNFQTKGIIDLSIDGPKELHDFHRKDKGDHETFDGILQTLRLLKKHQVEFNILCMVNSKNAHDPLEISRFFPGRTPGSVSSGVGNR